METGSNSYGNQLPPRRRKRRRPVVVDDDSAQNETAQYDNAQNAPPSQRRSRQHPPASQQQSYPEQHQPPTQQQQQQQEVQQRDIQQEEYPRRREQRFVQPSAMSQYPERSTSSPTPPPAVVAPLWLAIPRAVAFFLGLITLWNLFGEKVSSQVHSHFWWIDLGLWSPQIARGVMGVAAVIFLLFAAITQFPRLLRTIAMIVTITLLLVSVKSSYDFYQQINSGEIFAVGLFPASLYTASLLMIVLVGLLTESGLQKETSRAFLLGAFVFILCLLEFPLAQMYCEGKTDYRRKADVAVVFQCRNQGDSKPILTLNERMRTACELYKTGLVRKLILSGGSSKEAVHDITLMQQYATKHGVPSEDIQRVQHETDAITQKNIEAIAMSVAKDDPTKTKNDSPEERPSMLLVTHFYQQPRIKLHCNRLGLVTYTVPVKESDKATLLKSPIMSEAMRLWRTWLKPMKPQP